MNDEKRQMIVRQCLANIHNAQGISQSPVIDKNAQQLLRCPLTITTGLQGRSNGFVS
jgi:hypothetical protein